MNMRSIYITAAAACSIGLCCLGNAGAATSPVEMPSRVKLSGVPEDNVTLRSITAPQTNIELVPTAADLALAAQRSKFAPASALATSLGIKQQPVRGSAPRRVGSVFPSGVDSTVVKWQPLPEGGYVTHLRISSRGAMGIRARLLLPVELTQGELRAVAKVGDIAQRIPLNAALNGEIWTPATDGPSQIIEIFTTQPVFAAAIKRSV